MTNPFIEHHRPSLRDLPAFSQRAWQMSYGERTVIEGVLAMLKPRLAIEIGRAEGGSLRRVAHHSAEVISFDIVDVPAEFGELSNVKMLTGDSHTLLPEELARIAGEGRNVDFVLVDGDHSAAGVRRDMKDLLDSAAIANTIILAHDTLNEDVRQGLEELDYDAYEKVAWVDLDYIPGYVARFPARLGECWGGIGLIVVDATHAFQATGAFWWGAPRRGQDLFEQPKLVWPAARWIRRNREASTRLVSEITLVSDDLLAEARNEAAALAADLERHQSWLRGIEGSASWRLTAPLRGLKGKRRFRRR
jgi:hypothetical protein